jgi:cAMP-dependent protein kinase regulator
MSVVDGLPFAEDKKKYILEVLDPILEEMVSDVLTEMPKSPLDHMIRWLRKRSGGVASSRLSVQAKNTQLKQELKLITGSLVEAGASTTDTNQKDEEEEEEDEDDEIDDIPDRMTDANMSRGRQSVSAEAYGNWNQKKAFVAPKYPKTDDQKDRLAKTLLKSFMFNELEGNDMETVLMAMKEEIFKLDQKVMTEGDDGDFLFVIEKGSFDCIKKIEGEDKVVKTCAPGDVFGELALLYNQTRAASVIAKGDDNVAWKLDRESFNNIVKEAAVKRRNKYMTFLQKVTLIQSIDEYQRSQVADALVSEAFKKGDVIVKQDEPGDKFYMLEEGSLYATKTGSEGEKRVLDYKAGDYFGELALLKNQPRAASIVVASDTAKVLSMSRSSFNRLLGPLQALLEKKVASYK